MKTSRWFVALTLVGYALVFAAGCESSSAPNGNAGGKAASGHEGHDHSHDGHDHGHDHDHGDEKGKTTEAKPATGPKTYAEAVTTVVAKYESIRDSFGKKDVDGAHGPLHDIGKLLEQVPVLAGQESKDEAALGEVKKAVDALFDNYTKVDEKLHGEEGATYEEVAEKIDAAIEQLKKIELPKADK